MGGSTSDGGRRPHDSSLTASIKTLSNPLVPGTCLKRVVRSCMDGMGVMKASRVERGMNHMARSTVRVVSGS